MTEGPKPTDEALFAAYVDGDVQAFNELFLRYAPRLIRLFRRDIWRPQDAEELVQETFLRAHRACKDFKQGLPLRPWLITIALNLKREYLRRKGRRPEAPLELDGRRDPSVTPDLDGPRDARILIAKGLAALPENQRTVIELHWFTGLSFAEISTIVGASVSAVKVRAHRGYKQMRAQLAGEA